MSSGNTNNQFPVRGYTPDNRMNLTQKMKMSTPISTDQLRATFFELFRTGYITKSQYDQKMNELNTLEQSEKKNSA
jgi:hypothetical protein